MLVLQGDEQILDVATGTGRVARPVAKRLKGGRVIGVDQALAMLDVGHQHADPIPAYYQSAGEADALPLNLNLSIAPLCRLACITFTIPREW